jgi:hypothetical protein
LNANKLEHIQRFSTLCFNGFFLHVHLC